MSPTFHAMKRAHPFDRQMVKTPAVNIDIPTYGFQAQTIHQLGIHSFAGKQVPPEAFLASCVPDGELDPLVLHSYELESEVDPCREDEGLDKGNKGSDSRQDAVCAEVLPVRQSSR